MSLCVLCSLIEAAGATFTHGVASGDVRPTSAVLWTRADRETDLALEVSPDPAFQRGTLTRGARALAVWDFTVKVLAAPLEPDRTYFYRWTDGISYSETGTFKTPPARDSPATVRFAYSGDSDGTLVGGAPFFNRFEVLDAARREDLDFFVYLGDTIYADSGLRGPAGPALTLDQYRQTYKVNRDFAALRELLRATSIYAIWDDHEVHNDYAGQTVDPRLFESGRRAFLEYMPIGELPLPDPRSCAADPLFRLFHWGRDVDIIILDERSCRSADAAAACTLAPGVPDPAPTLPALFRIAAGLSPAPPPGCLDAIFAPSRTLLGGFQKLVFKSALLYSKAKFKFVINQVPIQQLFALPYDRWEGYAAERNEVLSFIRDNRIENVIFLTTDAHASLVGEVVLDRFRDPQRIADEFVTGPIATFTLQKELDRFFPFEPALLSEALNLAGVQCHNLDAFSYGLIQVSAGVATVSLKDDQGTVLCSRTIGP